MGRIIGVDYGLKRVGLACTDPLQLIASPLETVPSHRSLAYLVAYCQREDTEAFVVGLPKNLDNTDTHATKPTEAFVRKLKEAFPGKPVYWHDERFTSKMALDAMIAGGTSKKYRQQKENTDKISAAIILQSFLASKK